MEKILARPADNLEDIMNIYGNTLFRICLVLELVNPKMMPYSKFDQMGVLSYEILDENGNVIYEGNENKLFDIKEGNISVNIPLLNIPEGTYKLSISEIGGSKKADQPLPIHGNWECEFVH